MRFRSFPIWHLALVALAAAQAPDTAFRIQVFRLERVYDQPANKVWEPEEKNRAALAPEAVGPSDFVLRRKFGAREYALFGGRMLDGAYGNLFAFRMDSALAKNRLGIKLYSARGVDWFHDIEDAYFLGDLILSGQPLLYYRSGSEWHELKALPRKPMRLVLRSDPPGARVSVDDKALGITPWIQMGLVEPHVIIRMERDGYYSREEPVGFEQSSEATVNWRLSRLLPADTLATADSLPLAALSLPDAPSLDAYESRQAKVQEKIRELSQLRSAAIARFDSVYPPLKPQEEFERSSEFAARKKAYGEGREVQQAAATAAVESRLQSLYQADHRIETNKEPLEKKLVQTELTAPTLELGRYDADREKLPFQLRATQPPLWFHYAGKLAIDRALAMRFKANPDSVQFTVSYWNLRMRVDETRVVSPSIDSVRCVFAGRPIRILEDTLAYPPAITNQPTFFRIQSRVEEFDHARAQATVQAEQEKLARARLTRKAKWRHARLYSGLGLAAVSIGVGILAYHEKTRADEFYANYRAALSVQQAQAQRHAADVHDKQSREWGIFSGAGVGVGVALCVF